MEFVVNQVGSDTTAMDKVLVCGGSNFEEGENFFYFNFQRNLSPEDDSGIYFEYRDQSTGEYNLIQNCTLNREGLLVNIKYKPPTSKEIEVKIQFQNVDETEIEELKKGLIQIFKGYEQLFNINT